MFGKKEREYASCGFMDFEALADFAEELSFDELLSVNGGCGGGCGGGGGGSYTPSYSPSRPSSGGGSSSTSGCGGAGTSSSSSSSSGCGGRSSTSSSCGGGVRTTSSSSGCGGGVKATSSSSSCGGSSSSSSCGGGNTKSSGDNTNSNSDKDKESGTNNTYVENSNEGIANAKPGDKIIRKDGTEITLTQGDIDWAKSQIGNNSTSVETSPSDSKNEDNIVNTEPIKENPESPTDSGTEKKEEKDVGAPTAGLKSDQPLKDGQPAKIENATETKDKVINSISDNWDKQYSYTNQYQCDNWVQEVLKDAGIDSSKYLTGGDASQKTVQEHIDALTAADSGKKVNVDYYTERPTQDGAYVVFMDDGSRTVDKDGKKTTVAVDEHCAIMVIKDGETSFYDNSSGNGGTPYDASGKIVELSKSDHAAVSYYDQGVGRTDGNATWCYKTMYYQKIL